MADNKTFSETFLQNNADTQKAQADYYNKFNFTPNLTQQRQLDRTFTSQDLQLQQKQSDASFSNKVLAFDYKYRTETMVGSIEHLLGSDSPLATYVDKTDYTPQEGYKAPISMVIKLANEVNLRPEQMKELMSADSPQYFVALSSKFRKDFYVNNFVNETLTKTQQTMTNLATGLLDIPSLLSLGIPAGGSIGLLNLSTKAINTTALTSASVTAVKPYLIDSINKQGRDSGDLALEAVLGGALEFAGVKFFTPEISNPLSKTAGKTAFVHQNGYMHDINVNQVFKWSAEDATNPSSFIKTEGIPQNLIDNIKIQDAVTSEVIDSLGEVAVKTKLTADVTAFSKASKDIKGMFDNITEIIRTNKIESPIVQNTLKTMRKEANLLMNEFRKVKGVSKEFADELTTKINKSIDDVESQTVLKDTKVQVNSINKLIENIKANKSLIKKYGNTKAIDRLVAKSKALKKQLNELKVKHKSNPTEETTKAIKKTNTAIKRNKTDIAKAQDREIANIQNKMMSEVDGGVTLKKVKGGYSLGGKVIPATLVVGLFGTGAFASDGNGGTGSAVISGIQDLMVLAVVASMGYSAFTKIKMARAMKARINAVNGVSKAIEEQATMQQKATQALHGNYEFTRNFFTETFSPLMQYAESMKNHKLKDFLQKTLVDPLNGRSNVAEEIKAKIFRKFQGNYKVLEDKHFSKWLKEQDISVAERVVDAITGKYREIFRENVTSAKDGALDISVKGADIVKSMAKESTKLLEDTGVRFAKELGVEGADLQHFIKGYVKRSYKTSILDTFRSMLQHPEQAKILKDNFKAMYLSAVGGSVGKFKSLLRNIDKTTEALTNGTKKMSDVLADAKSRFSDILADDEEMNAMLKGIESETDTAKAIEKYKAFIKKGSELDSEANATTKIDNYLAKITQDGHGGLADVFGSFKSRVPLDLSKFKVMKDIQVGSEIKDYSLANVFERNDFSLSNRYMAQVSGRIGLQASGYSVEQAKAILKSIPHSRERTIAEKALNSILGIPVMETIDNGVLQATQISGNVAIASSIPLVALSFLQETGYLLARMAFNHREAKAIFSNMVSIIRDTGDDSALATMARRRFGLGTNVKSGNIGSRIDVDMQSIGIELSGTNATLNTTKLIRDYAFKYFGLLAGSDILELGNAVANMQRLHDVANGIKKLDSALLKKYGLSAEDLRVAKKYLKVNDRGVVMEPDWAKMTTKEEMQLSTTIINMGQTGAQRTTIGGMPSWTRDNIFGSSVSKLLSYTINSYANLGLHQLRGLSSGSIETTLQIMGGFAGAYVGALLRDSIRGKTRKDDSHYYRYALTSVALFAPYSMARGLLDPVMFSGTRQELNRVDSQAKHMFDGTVY